MHATLTQKPLDFRQSGLSETPSQRVHTVSQLVYPPSLAKRFCHRSTQGLLNSAAVAKLRLLILVLRVQFGSPLVTLNVIEDDTRQLVGPIMIPVSVLTAFLTPVHPPTQLANGSALAAHQGSPPLICTKPKAPARLDNG